MSPQLVKQALPIPLGTMGLEAGPEPRLVQQGLLRLENGVWNRRGAIEKRDGLATIGTVPAGQSHLAAFGGKLVSLGDKLLVWNTSASTWDEVGDLGLWDYFASSVTTIPQAPITAEVAISGDVMLVVYSWFERGPVGLVNQYDDYSHHAWAKTFSVSSGALLDSKDLGGPAWSAIYWPGGRATPWPIRTAVVGGTIWAYYCGPIQQRFSVAADGTIGNWATFHTTLATYSQAVTARWDLCVSGSVAVAAYPNASGDITLLFVSGSSVTEVIHPANVTEVVGVFELRSGVVVVAYWDSGDTSIKAVGYSTAGAVAITEATLASSGIHAVKAIVGAPTSSTTATIYWTDANAASIPTDSDHDYRILKNSYTDTAGAGSAGTSVTFLTGALVACKPMVNGSDHYLPVSPDIPLGLGQVGQVVLDSNGNAIAINAVGYQYAAENLQPAAPIAGSYRWPVVSYGKWFGGSKQRVSNPSQQGLGFGLSLITLTAGLEACKAIDTGASLLIPGAVPRECDGAQVVEFGFLQYPHKCYAATSADLGSNLGTGTYGYCWVYEWFDSLGRRYLSAPSPACSVATVSQGIRITYPPKLTLTEKTDWRAALYRTLRNGATYHRLGVVESHEFGGIYTYFADNTSDADIEDEEQLYTGGGEVQNLQLAPWRVGCLHQNRVCVVPIEDEQAIWQSKQLRPSMGIRWGGDVLSYRIDAGGALTALESFFGRLLAFSASRIVVLEGAPRDDAGAGRGFSDYQLENQIGCLGHRELAQAPDSVLFLSAQGLRAVDKSLQVKDVGEGIKYHTSSLTVARAVCRPERATLITSDGLALELNTELGLWSSLTGHQAVDAAVVGDLLYLVTSSRDLKREAAGTHLDGTSAIQLLLESGHLSPANLGGRCRLKRLLVGGYNLSSHKLHAAFQYDGDGVWCDDQIMTSSDLGGYFDYSSFFGAGLAVGYADKAYVIEAAPSRQVVSTFRFRLYDELSTAAAGGLSIVWAAVEVAVKSGAAKADSVRRTS